MLRINFLFALLILLTTCTPNATLAPLPTVSSTPVVSITPTNAAIEIPSIVNPISPANMAMLKSAEYRWDAITGSLINRDGKTVLTLQNGKWVDGSGAEKPLEALKPILVNGVDFKGKDIGAILTREVDGETQIYLPTSDIWVKSLDIVGDRVILEKNDIPRDLKNWQTEIKIDKNDIPLIPWEDVVNGNLFYSTVLYQLDPLVLQRKVARGGIV